MADSLEDRHSSTLGDDTRLALQPQQDVANCSDNHPPNASLLELLHGIFAAECVTCIVMGFLCGGGVIISVLSARFECR
jgi:hypothetical protein